MIAESRDNNWVLRAIYFAMAGWGLGIIVAGTAWFFMITIVGLPVGLWLMDRMATVISLRPEEELPRRGWNYAFRGQQRPLWRRLVYFVLVGWWLSALWIGIALLLQFSVIGLPLTFWMFEQVAGVSTLYRGQQAEGRG